MSNNILLSIVIPSYNKAKQLPRLLDSIINSCKFDNSIEVIICDDCSTDDTTEIVKIYLEKYNNIKYILAEENGGVHYVRNLGMKSAKGEYIAFIDGDDYLNSEGLEKTINCIKNNLQYDMLFLPYITSDTKEKTGYTKSGEISFIELFDNNIFLNNKNCLGIIRKELIDANNVSWYYTNLDSLFWRECEYYAKKIFVCDDVVGVYDKSTEGSLSKKRQDINHVIKHADNKIKSTLLFMDRMKEFFIYNKSIACKYINSLLYELSYSKNYKYNYQEIKKYVKIYNCNNIFKKLLIAKIKAKIKKFIKNRNYIILGLIEKVSIKIRYNLLKFRGLNLGNNVKIYGKVIISGNPSNITIGDNSTINYGVIFNAHEKITIGKNCRISNYVQLHSTSLDIDTRKHIDKAIKLDDNVWLASGCIINAGTDIGKNTIVGANSFVRGYLEENSFYAGNPAQLKKRI